MYILTYDAHISDDRSHTERWDKVWDEELGMKAVVSSGDEVPKSEVPLKCASGGGDSNESQWREPPKLCNLLVVSFSAGRYFGALCINALSGWLST